MPQLDFFRRPARPWNTGRIIGAKPPFKPKHVWAIRQQLKTNGRTRDLALFDCAIDAKLRGCDLVKLRVSDVAPGGSATGRFLALDLRPKAALGGMSPLAGERQVSGGVRMSATGAKLP